MHEEPLRLVPNEFRPVVLANGNLGRHWPAVRLLQGVQVPARVDGGIERCLKQCACMHGHRHGFPGRPMHRLRRPMLSRSGALADCHQHAKEDRRFQSP